MNPLMMMSTRMTMKWKTRFAKLELEVGDTAECIVPSSIPDIILKQNFGTDIINGFGWEEGKKVVITRKDIGMRTGLVIYHFGERDDYAYEHTLRKVF